MKVVQRQCLQTLKVPWSFLQLVLESTFSESNPCVTGASFPHSIRGVLVQPQVCAWWLLCHLLLPLTFSLPQLSLEQVCMGSTALLLPKSSFRRSCGVPGFPSLPM